MAVCKGCKERFLGCHGKNKDGTWRCKRWGEEEEMREAERRERKGQYEADCYFADFRRERARMEQSHHALKGKK